MTGGPTQAAAYFFANARDYAPALVTLAVLYRRGEGVKKDPARAVDLFTAAGDHPKALVGCRSVCCALAETRL